MRQLRKAWQQYVKLIFSRGSNPPFKFLTMCYIVIETFGGAEYATIVTDQDGNNLVFENREDAEAEAADCQDGMIVEL
jgi:hypothetical protein